MKNRVLGGMVAAALTVPTVAVVTTPAAEGATLYYSSCAKLTVKFSHGVAKSYKAAKKQVNDGYGMPAYGTLAKKVYWKNKSRLDRDNDGTACER